MKSKSITEEMIYSEEMMEELDRKAYLRQLFLENLSKLNIKILKYYPEHSNLTWKMTTNKNHKKNRIENRRRRIAHSHIGISEEELTKKLNQNFKIPPGYKKFQLVWNKIKIEPKPEP